MFNVSLYKVGVSIDIQHEDELVATASQEDVAWVEVSVDRATGRFDLMGVSQMDLDFMSDDCIIFKTSKGFDCVSVRVTKPGMARTVGRMLGYLADTTTSLFERDED